MHKFWLWVGIVFCLTIFLVTLYRAIVFSSAAAYTFAVVPFIAFFALFAVGVLEYKVGGATISLESKVQDLERQNTELSEAIRALVSCIVVVEDGASRYNGPGKVHEKLMSEYLETISKHFEPGFIESARNAVEHAVVSSAKNET